MTSSIDRNTSLERDPIFEALDRAPRGEPFTEEQRAELDEAMEDIAEGRVKLIANDDVPAWLEARAREEADLAAE
jgi:hypothetical protein